MNALALGVAALLSVVAAPLVAQGFEGEIRFVASGVHYAHPDTMSQISKGSRIRWQTLIDDDSVRFVLLPERKQYIEMSGSARGDGDDIVMPKDGSIVNTGRVDTVAGIPCERWHYAGTNADGTPDASDACLAKNAGLMLNRRGGHTDLYYAAGGRTFAAALSLETGVLKVTDNGEVTFIVISAQPMAVADSMFIPPSNYHRLTLPKSSNN